MIVAVCDLLTCYDWINSTLITLGYYERMFVFGSQFVLHKTKCHLGALNINVKKRVVVVTN